MSKRYWFLLLLPWRLLFHVRLMLFISVLLVMVFYVQYLLLHGLCCVVVLDLVLSRGDAFLFPARDVVICCV